MSDVNTKISLFHVEFSRYCLWSAVCCVKTLLASVGVSQVCSPYSAQLCCYSFVTIRISWLFENNRRIWSFRANSGFSLYWAKICWKVCTKVPMIWFGSCINTIKLLFERHKAFYSVGSSNNCCLISEKIDISRALIHEFLSRSNSYYEMKLSTGNMMGEHLYSFYGFVATRALNTRKLIGSVAPCHRFVVRIRS